MMRLRRRKEKGGERDGKGWQGMARDGSEDWSLSSKQVASAVMKMN